MLMTARLASIARSAISYFALFALGLSIAANIVLLGRLGQCMPMPIPSQPFHAGTRLPNFDAVSLDGKKVHVTYGGQRPTILYYFSTSCRWCSRNWPNVQAVLDHTRGRYRFLGITASSDAKRFMDEGRLTFDCVTVTSPETLRRYRLGSTPRTIVVSTDGRVVKDWRGAYTGPVAKEMAGFFGLTLPGIETAASSAPPR